MTRDCLPTPISPPLPSHAPEIVPRYTVVTFLGRIYILDHANMTEPSTGRYEHSPLRNHSSIRLLTLLPESHGTPLRCQITEFEDSSAVSYEAMSYAWGDFVFPETIQVCESADVEQIGGYIPITRNLFQGLLRLRADAPRMLWIDALCVNQADPEEKACQVARMGRVYREAKRVVVWLGEDKTYPRTRALLMQDGKNRWPLTRPESDLGELVTIPW